jgi:hypothetical protein
MKKLILSLLGLLIFGLLQAQNTLSLAKNQPSPEASIADVAWIAGHWRGDAMGGLIEEIWSPPLGKAMMGSFKLVIDEEVNFYELETITETNGSLILKIKHFDAALTGWEEKDETVDFPLVKLTENTAFFDGLTFELISTDALNIYVLMEGEGPASEAKFSFKRFK